jgi:hypothetical protein
MCSTGVPHPISSVRSTALSATSSENPTSYEATKEDISPRPSAYQMVGER